jgi:hypothetical protein
LLCVAGASSPQSHVVVSNEWIGKLTKPNSQELHILETYVPKEDLSAKYVAPWRSLRVSYRH